MKLFDIQHEMAIPSEEARTIIEFKRLLMRDKGSGGDHDGRKKLIGLMELAYVHFNCVFDSRFDIYETNEQREQAIRVSVGLPNDWKPDKLIKDACDRYRDLMQTESMRLVEKTRRAIRKIEDFIDGVDLEERNTKTEAYIFSADKLQSIIKEMPKMILSLNEAKKIVDKEIEDKFGSKLVNKSVVETSNVEIKGEA